MRSLVVCLTFLCLFVQTSIQQDNEKRSEYWQKLSYDALLKSSQIENIVKPAKNVILFLGDGMGVSTVTAARVLKRQLKKGDQLEFENFPNVGFAKTYNVDFTVPDSAGTGTAYCSGVKANKGVIGLNAQVAYKETDCAKILQNKVESAYMHAIKAGKAAGIVSTASVTDASPAATYAHVSDRYHEYSMADNTTLCKDIALQLIENSPGANYSVILGGGMKNFLPESLGGARLDGRNLFKQWEKNMQDLGLKNEEFKHITNQDELSQINTDVVKKLFGTFSVKHMNYDMERNESTNKQPSLTEMTVAAIKILSKHSNGYFLFVEGANIDKAHHDNRAYQALHDTLMFDEAISKTISLVDLNETLIIVTADHSHGFAHSGYPLRTDNVFGFSQNKDSGDLLYTSLLYTTGPGKRDITKNQTIEETSDGKYEQQAAVELDSGAHSGEDVGVYAIGPMSHLLRSTQEQTFVSHLMSFSSCIGKYTNEKHCPKSASRMLTSNLTNSFITFTMALFLNRIINHHH